jgi:hypothetical protein
MGNTKTVTIGVPVFDRDEAGQRTPRTDPVEKAITLIKS